MELFDSESDLQVLDNVQNVFDLVLSVSDVLPVRLPTATEVKCTKVGSFHSVCSDYGEQLELASSVPMKVQDCWIPLQIPDEDQA